MSGRDYLDNCEVCEGSGYVFHQDLSPKHKTYEVVPWGILDRIVTPDDRRYTYECEDCEITYHCDSCKTEDCDNCELGEIRKCEECDDTGNLFKMCKECEIELAGTQAADVLLRAAGGLGGHAGAAAVLVEDLRHCAADGKESASRRGRSHAQELRDRALAVFRGRAAATGNGSQADQQERDAGDSVHFGT